MILSISSEQVVLSSMSHVLSQSTLLGIDESKKDQCLYDKAGHQCVLLRIYQNTEETVIESMSIFAQSETSAKQP